MLQLLALVCADGRRRTCAVNCRRNSLSCCVGDFVLVVGEGVLEGGFVAVCLVGHRERVWRSWLDSSGIICWLQE